MLVFSHILLSFGSIFTGFIIFQQYFHRFCYLLAAFLRGLASFGNIFKGFGKFSNPQIIGMLRCPPSWQCQCFRLNYFHCPALTKVDLSEAWLIFQNNIPPTSKSFGSPRQGSTIATLVGALVTISARTSRSEKSFVLISSIVHISEV